MKSEVLETNDKVYIRNIPRLEWGKNKDNSFIRSTQLALNSIGEDYQYEFLMGISGAAFRFLFHPDWCPSSTDATAGFDVSRVLFRSLGYNCAIHSIDDNSFEDIQSLYQRIIAQINIGIPVIAINLKVCPEWGLITGYLKNKPGLLCRTYFDDSNEYSFAERAPWLTFFINEKGTAINQDTLFRNSLELAVQLANTSEFEEYRSGFSAFNLWIEKLKNYTNGKDFLKNEENLTILYNLLDSRRAATKYLKLLDVNSKLKKGDKIIENYMKEVSLMQGLIKNVLPEYGASADNWTKEIIDKQITTLTKVLEIEKATVKLIEEELDIAIGKMGQH